MAWKSRSITERISLEMKNVRVRHAAKAEHQQTTIAEATSPSMGVKCQDHGVALLYTTLSRRRRMDDGPSKIPDSIMAGE